MAAHEGIVDVVKILIKVQNNINVLTKVCKVTEGLHVFFPNTFTVVCFNNLIEC